MTTYEHQMRIEAIYNLECFIKTGLIGFAQKAYDRIVALGYMPCKPSEWSKNQAYVFIDELRTC